MCLCAPKVHFVYMYMYWYVYCIKSNFDLILYVLCEKKIYISVRNIRIDQQKLLYFALNSLHLKYESVKTEMYMGARPSTNFSRLILQQVDKFPQFPWEEMNFGQHVYLQMTHNCQTVWKLTASGDYLHSSVQFSAQRLMFDHNVPSDLETSLCYFFRIGEHGTCASDFLYLGYHWHPCKNNIQFTLIMSQKCYPKHIMIQIYLVNLNF